MAHGISRRAALIAGTSILAAPLVARAQAARVLLYQRDRMPEALAMFKTAADDESPRVRLEAVRAASFYGAMEHEIAIEFRALYVDLQQ